MRTPVHAPGAGSAYRYDHGCSCDECREAKRAKRKSVRDRARAENRPSYQRELATSRKLKEAQRGTCESCGAPTSWAGGAGRGKAAKLCLACSRVAKASRHGTNGRYSLGCRCDQCRSAHAAYMRDYYRRKKAAA